ncbi:MAG: hypothetical protein A2Z04_04840 [Chloroflexi bacterium RBG_16_57_9]|nr:MAG: hypothetical protein A2Z04_04840 [Chloroflexi bacterium RBG_16_57_9]
MKILAVDVGTGTQDILLFDTDKEIENCFKLVMPSPTVLVAREIRKATAQGQNILLTGTIMGGGPCTWAVSDHLKAGYQVYATPLAAQTFDDDLENVEHMGVRLVEDDVSSLSGSQVRSDDFSRPGKSATEVATTSQSRDRVIQVRSDDFSRPGKNATEVATTSQIRDQMSLNGVRRVEMKDFYFDAIRDAFHAFGVELEVDALALAVFDHGAAPPGYSDRRFRFDYLEERLRAQNGLAGFAFWRAEIPDRFTRLQAVASSAPPDLSVMVMDTGPAAVLGALEDRRVRAQDPVLIANVGNFHCLAFHVAGGEVVGVFEHHTGELTREELVTYLRKLADGSLTNQEVFDDMGHGALVFKQTNQTPDLFTIVGPRRGLLRESALPIYQAVPHGDMMLVGCFGLIRAYAQKDAAHGDEIAAVLDGTAEASSPW